MAILLSFPFQGEGAHRTDGGFKHHMTSNNHPALQAPLLKTRWGVFPQSSGILHLPPPKGGSVCYKIQLKRSLHYGRDDGYAICNLLSGIADFGSRKQENTCNSLNLSNDQGDLQPKGKESERMASNIRQWYSLSFMRQNVLALNFWYFSFKRKGLGRRQ